MKYFEGFERQLYMCLSKEFLKSLYVLKSTKEFLKSFERVYMY